MNSDGRPRLCACGTCHNCERFRYRAYKRFSRATRYCRWNLRFDEALADVQRLIYRAPAVADTREPHGKDGNPERIAEADKSLDTREREWRVDWKDGFRRDHTFAINGPSARLIAESYIRHEYNFANVQYSDDGGKTWVDADTPSDKEQK